MARGVLVRAAMLSCAISAGCFLPTPLDPAPQSSNLRPVIVADKVDPRFGILNRTVNDRFELVIAAEDANNEERLYARLFRAGAGSGPRMYDGFEITLVAQPPGPSPLPVTEYTGRFFSPAGINVCSFFPSGDLYVVVADLPFCNPRMSSDCTTDGEVPEPGLTDENHWTLECQ